MPSVAQLKDFTIAPLHGAILGALILATAWMIGIPTAFGTERTVAIPIALAIGAVLTCVRIREKWAKKAHICCVRARNPHKNVHRVS